MSELKGKETEMGKLNGKELRVLKTLACGAIDAAGGDFGMMEEINYRELRLTGQEFGGYVRALQKKKLIEVYDPYRVNNEGAPITQYTIESEGWKLAGYPEYAK